VCIKLFQPFLLPSPTHQLKTKPKSKHKRKQLFHEAEKREKMAQRKDYYKILQVDKSADARDVKRAYKRLAVQHHPDKAPAGEKDAYEAKFRDVAEAYEVLRDDEKRAAYDRGDDVEIGGSGGGFGGGGFPHGFHGGGGSGFTFTFTM
jgi:DnaJ family protein C protein 3